MSIAIDVDRVAKVLIANKWYDVARIGNSNKARSGSAYKPKSSFDIDAYEFIWPHPDPERMPRYLGNLDDAGSTCTGYTFKFFDTESNCHVKMSGPITEIQAIIEENREDEEFNDMALGAIEITQFHPFDY